MIDEAEARKIVEAALKGAEEATAILSGGTSALTRFGDNTITQNLEASRRVLSVTVSSGRRSATVVSNRPGAPLAARAAELAKLAPEDPEFVDPLGPQEYARILAHHPGKFGPRERAEAAVAAIDVARSGGLSGFGAASSAETFTAMGNTRGLWAFHPTTSSGFSVTMRTKDGTGSSRASREDERRSNGIDAKALAGEAAERAVASKGAREIPPGDYTVVLTPQAVADLLGFVAMALGAREADEGLSALAGKLGKKIAAEAVTLRTKPGHASLLASPFDGEGMPVVDRTWIEKGVLRNLHYSRYWAKKQGKEPTTSPSSLVLEGGTAKSLEELVSGTEKGLLITRFWYIRMVDAKSLLLTGLTRDGVFRIEAGKVTHPVVNYRFNESPLVVLNNVEAMTAPSKVGGQMIPAIRASSFTLSSPSRAT